MIRHHEGAIEIAEVERATGEHRPALDLADRIVDSQTHEIDVMEQLLS
jgi:uncharacterized protein (DUF305 family)